MGSLLNMCEVFILITVYDTAIKKIIIMLSFNTVLQNVVLKLECMLL